VVGVGGRVVVSDGSGFGGGSPQAGAAATHNIANAAAFATTSAITAALRERRRDHADLMPSPLAVSMLAILVRSEHSDVSSPLLKFVGGLAAQAQRRQGSSRGRRPTADKSVLC